MKPVHTGRTLRRCMLAALLVLAIAALGCSSRTSSSSAAASNRSPQKPEFLGIADKVQKGQNPYVGRAKVDDLLFQLQVTTPADAEGRKIRSDLSRELLRLGEIDSALVYVNESIAAYEAAPERSPGESELYLTRALGHLREAEIANCVQRHNRDCCIFPLQQGGVHAVSEPARLAKEDYLRYLESPRPSGTEEEKKKAESKRVTAIWLLNIACMALDEYPQGVPAKYRIDPSLFESEADIGRFTDVATQVGITDFDHAGGGIVDDIDGDGLLDVVSSTCDVRGPMKAFRNRGDGTFEDAASAWRLDDQLGGLHITGADYDNDGDLDILVPRGAWMYEDGCIRKSLLRNDGAEGFTDVTRSAGLAEPRAPTQAVAWADFDNDGLLDVYVGHESRAETVVNGPSYLSQLFHNNGDGTFTNIAADAGVVSNRFAKGVAAGDYDNDGDMDLYVSNVGPNRLYRNDGNLKFVDVAPELGMIEPKGRSFACWFFDYENDGDLDLWVNAYDAEVWDVALCVMGKPFGGSLPCLYRNNGDGTFTNIAREAGIAKAWLPMGCSFGDFDNDGWLDVYLGTGDPFYESLMPNIALRNDRGRRFQDITRSAGLGHLQKGHEVCFADIDDDGDQDVFHQLGGFFPGDAFPNALFLNPGHGHRFLKIELVGTKSNRQGVGARIEVRLETPDGPRSIHRAVGSISSFGQAPRRQEIGLANASAIASVEIDWPASQTHQTLTNVPLDSFLRVTEGKDGFETVPLHPMDLSPKAEKEIASASPASTQ